jgi:hypothetical protein
MKTATQPKTIYFPQCMNLGSAKVGQNIARAPYANEKAALDHIAAHVAKGCSLEHRVGTLTI